MRTFKLDPAFGFSNDDLGHVINNYVTALGRTNGMLDVLETEEGDFEFVREYLLEIHGSFCRLLDHLISCGAGSVRNDFLSVWANEDGDKIKSEVAR